MTILTTQCLCVNIKDLTTFFKIDFCVLNFQLCNLYSKGTVYGKGTVYSKCIMYGKRTVYTVHSSQHGAVTNS